jgi:hypothetical protein
MRRLIGLALLALAAYAAGAQGAESETRKRLLEIASKYRGVPYVYGAESPKAFDCSGFVRYVYREAYGLELPRSARGFYSAGIPIDWKSAKPGDVLIYDTVGGAPSHVAIFAGEGTVIHAVSEGPKTGVIVSPMADRYWSARLIAARTFLPLGAAAPARPSAPDSAQKATPGSSLASSSPEKAVPAEAAISDIGILVPAKKETVTDRIPTAAGTSVAFTVTNGTGAAGTFIVLFFRVHPKTYKLEQLHEERVALASEASFSLPPYRFDEAGKYKLVVKQRGDQLFEREFMVTADAR